MKSRITSLIVATFVASSIMFAQVQFQRAKLDGPRLGVTFVPGNTTLAQQLKDNGMDRTLSQFGWHFEYQVTPDGGGPLFLIEFIPLLAGVEYGTLIPSASLAMGIRFIDGFEFGMGPNLILTDKGPKTALVIAVGKSLDYGGVNIPLNLVVTKNPDGLRTSFIFGYAITK